MEKYLLPVWDNNTKNIIDGTFVKIYPFCFQGFQNEKCLSHYAKMETFPTGFYTCPYGLSTFVYEIADLKFIFSGFHEKSTYRKKQIGQRPSHCSEYIYNPILTSEQIANLVEASIRSTLQEKDFTRKIDFADDIIHEIRSLNSTIKAKCDSIWNLFPQYEDEQRLENPSIEVTQYIRNIHAASYMVQSRFMLYDFFRNSAGQAFGEAFNGGVYKKFDKLRMLLSGYGKKRFKILFDGNSRLCYPIYSSFEILVFLILENAIKYLPSISNDNIEEIRVKFSESANAYGNSLVVFVKSEGPYCNQQELSNIFIRGIRGENAKRAEKSGHGIGLYLSKTLSDIHKIELKISSEFTRKINGIPYGTFTVKMLFDSSLIHEPQNL